MILPSLLLLNDQAREYRFVYGDQSNTLHMSTVLGLGTVIDVLRIASLTEINRNVIKHINVEIVGQNEDRLRLNFVLDAEPLPLLPPKRIYPDEAPTDSMGTHNPPSKKRKHE